MSKWYQIFPKNTGLSIYIWIIFCLIPFYFLFKSSPTIDFFIGIIMVILFFIAYRLSFISETWFVYVWVSFGMLIIIFMTLFFGYVFFVFFFFFFFFYFVFLLLCKSLHVNYYVNDFILLLFIFCFISFIFHWTSKK